MNGGTALSVPRERLVERALALIVKGEIAPGTAAQDARMALNQWRNKSPEHAAALLEARHRWDALGGMADGLRAHFDAPAAHTTAAAVSASSDRPERRKLLLSIAGMLGCGLVAGRGVQWYWQQPVFRAAYSTSTAQMIKLALVDAANGTAGTQLELAPQSVINVALYRQRRVVEMARGEVRFDVAHDTQRPFLVLTRGAIIEVVGTVFTVRDRGGPITVGVEQGHVRVQVRARNGTETPQLEVIDLRRGELVEVRDGHADAVRQSDTQALSAWRDGWFVFENTPLGDALAVVNSYRNQPIISNDPNIDALRLSGRFRTNDSVGLVALLPTILPVTAMPRPDGSVELLAR
ncbi:FecR family protein [Rhodoferax sp. OV413]|uniref:FecR family protein n=1 Tax=Rhodoferax sp. OV413 TaxID=1855285 RepID=UPI000891786F|nr:FecR domain-containing protein [Rhodoferax sp. OV413]SDP62362.1 FecR family protein [Rhodoferax sp. OV413]